MKKKIIYLSIFAALSSTLLLASCSDQPSVSSPINTSSNSVSVSTVSSALSSISSGSGSTEVRYSNFSMENSVICVPPSFYKVKEEKGQIFMLEKEGEDQIAIGVTDTIPAIGDSEKQKVTMEEWSSKYQYDILNYGDRQINNISYFILESRMLDPTDSTPIYCTQALIPIGDGSVFIRYYIVGGNGNSTKPSNVIEDIIAHSQFFESANILSNKMLNETITKQLNTRFQSFQTASWYPHIQKLEVYNEGSEITSYVTFGPQMPEERITTVVRSIAYTYADLGITKSVGLDSNGKVVLEFKKP